MGCCCCCSDAEPIADRITIKSKPKDVIPFIKKEHFGLYKEYVENF